jgi:hypothetical protein
MKRAAALYAGLLAACAGTPAEPPAAPATAEAAAPRPAPAPLSPERQRLENWKAENAAGDPRAGFARAAEEEAERRRSEALARGVTPDALDAEIRAMQLEELATGGVGCLPQEPDWATEDDWIPHRRLERADFQAPANPGGAPQEGFVAAATLSIQLGCVASTRAVEGAEGVTVELERVRFFAMLSRTRSWWNPRAPGNAEWRMRHVQLHFDIAELFAAEENARLDELRAETRATRPDFDAAAYAFRARLAERLAAQQRAFGEVEARYDRETRDGTDVAQQTEWFTRVKRGLGAVRAGTTSAERP